MSRMRTVLPRHALSVSVLLPLAITYGTESEGYSVVCMAHQLEGIADRVILWVPALSDPKKLKKCLKSLMFHNWGDHWEDIITRVGFSNIHRATCNNGKTIFRKVFPKWGILLPVR